MANMLDTIKSPRERALVPAVARMLALALQCLALLVASATLARAADGAAGSPTAKSTPLPVPKLVVRPAEKNAAAAVSMVTSAALAGQRLVAVGERGVVLLSDDGGATFRQARDVPVNASLTSVWFSSPKLGWAVGHWGVVVHTTDGGDTWTRQRLDMDVDQPLFSVYFKSDTEGWAVGLWSLMLHTTDGGAHWATVELPPPPGAKKADRNLYAIFGDARGGLYVACEQGRIMRSSDGGTHWTYVDTGYAGSFWSGVALSDGTLLLGGLRGTIYRSTNGGDSWASVQTPFKSSVTGMLQLPDHSVIAVALDGVVFTSRNAGLTFTGLQRPDHETLTAVAPAPGGQPVVFSADGPVSK
jgi:photosystem II stability/assembly factor-like uncharacterized protein